MESIKLHIKGRLFAECINMSEAVRLPNEMKDDACFVYIEQGVNNLYSRNEHLNISDRESVLMQCGNYVATFEDLSAESPLKSVLFHMDREMIIEAFGSTNLDFLQTKTPETELRGALKFEADKMIDAYVKSIEPYFDFPEQVSEELLLVKMKELVLLISNSGKNPVASQILGQAYSPETLEFDKVIENNLYNNLSINELAFLTHKSESTFKRYFNKWYGMPPAKYFRVKRLEFAESLLREAEYQVNEIAWKCGFDNPAHFSTVFHTHFGKSPKKYRDDLNSKVIELKQNA
jgi:AraC family transcriptional regulator, exoenzyme S synthesis regulatory protein ExsA